MAKKKVSLFECQACGMQSAKWMGKCPNCGAWESFIELSAEQQKVLNEISKTTTSPSKAKPITQIEEEEVSRFSSQDSELDLVLGGGIVPGSLVLIGGSPGIGKSTLLLKIGGNLAQQNRKVLYVSGEESGGQIKMRANRLGANHDNLYLLSEIRLEAVMSEVAKKSYDLIIIDSIQTLYSEAVPSAPGSVTQVRTITFDLMRLAKEKQIPIFIIGHITKEGSIAGPRVLEHMVDTVLYFEGDASKEIRMLRAFKNRFGSTSEVGIFEMTQDGLVSAKNIASKFFSRGKPQAGSAVTVIMEGTRPLVIEVQALVADSGYGNPKRSTTGFDASRLTMLLALLEKKLELPFNQYDVFVNIAGGIKINEPAADLAIIAAIISSFRNRPLSDESIFVGEVSLIGDIREVFHLEQRLREAHTLGFTKAIVPNRPSFKTPMKCFVAEEVAKVVEWM
ncbi:DNA repair protein RadA [Hydrogenimonas thermophila]|uniref:DNA repair protein RadA n=1 Tax=Hydrogenimonas thermophila TaxID=223786 RepID=UPI002937173D|nr:DNA repair protein RadA [Hydrogenimonas thermophila]WOE68846.1 DNA repair protein RadA [Hydrogenimonas thermophila]WOE71354.1 DNA repair protein RadA [Hydrogenimonas thermophila]